MEEQADYTARASLALIGRSFRAMELWPIVCEQVHIPQKVKQYQPHEKLLDCFINILAGGQGLIEIETLVATRSGPTTRVWAQRLCGTIDDQRHAGCV